MSPLIDICVPTWNCNRSYFQQAIDSALAQTETRWRMVIHDDASTVDMEAMVKPYLSDPRITWHPNKKKLGIGGNWNATMKLGDAPYVQFLFPDDWWDQHFLQKGLAVMEQHPDVGIVSLGHTYVGDNHDALVLYRELEAFREQHLQAGKHDGREMLRWWTTRGLHPNIIGEPDFVMMRRSLMEEVGPYLEDMRQNLDVEYAVRCLLQSDWYYVKEKCGSFRVHDAAESAVNQREGRGAFDRFRCLDILIHTLEGDDKNAAIAARNNALTGMARNYLKRLKQKHIVSPAGGGAFKKFAVRHPFLVIRALWRAVRSTEA